MKKINKKNNFITKDYLDRRLKSELSKNTDRIIKYIDYRFKPVEELKDKFVYFQDKVLKTLDWIVGKLEKYDQEYTIMSSKYPYFSDKIENHEKRIKVIEKKSAYKTS